MTSNICRANFNGGRTAQGNNRFQWDYGQILEISGITNLPDPFVAQFSNTPVLGTAKSTVGTGGRVEIPNEYFVSGQNIYCFIVLHTDEDDGRTVYIATIPVTKRPKPIDDPITPTQQSTIDTAIAALQAGVAKAEGFAGDATEQAGIAQNAATTATEAAETATGAVADVEAAATRAEQAADGAAASATAASGSASDSAASASAAAGSAGTATTASGNASQAAQNASQSATAASGSATSAAGSATAAAGSATTAGNKATEAAESATAAAGSATTAGASATAAQAAQTAAETAQGKAEDAQAAAEAAAQTLVIDPTLTQPNQAAEAKATGDAISLVKSQISEAVSETQERITEDIYDNVIWTNGYVTNAGVVYNGGSTYHYTTKIAVSAGDIISIPTVGGKTIRYITAYNGESVVSGSGATYTGSYTVPNGVNFVIVTLEIVYGVIPLYFEHTVTVYKNILSDAVERNTNAVESITESEEYKKETVEEISPTFTSGYMDTRGTAHSSGSYKYTQKISVAVGQVISLSVSSGSKNFRFLCAYHGEIAVPAKGVSADSKQYIVPDGIDGVVLTCYSDAVVNKVLITTYTNAIAIYVRRQPFGYTAESGTLNDGESLSLPVQNSKTYNRLIFNCRVSAFSGVTIEKGIHSFAIDGTNIVLTGYGSTPSVTIPHGLSISDTLSILIENNADEKTSLIRVSSHGDEFSYTTPFEYNVAKGAWKITSNGSTLTNCTFSWTSKTINSNLWIFGDSYVSIYNTRWTYYLVRDGFAEHCMINGFAGENSIDALAGLKNLLNLTTPKIIVWCLGMNDADTSSAVNANWKYAYDEVVNLKKKYGFELILYTVPTTPSINNNYKNAIIRSSGYRYIDIDSAVRLSDSTSWIAGALSPDNVHPTAEGAKIIYYKVLADLPEVMSMD